jgi:hypothetical protein
MKKSLWLMITLACLGFFLTGPSAANAQDRNAGQQKKITSQTGKAEKPQGDKPRQAAEPSKKNGKKVIMPGKDLS